MQSGVIFYLMNAPSIATATAEQNNAPRLLGIDGARKAVFEGEHPPSLRAWNDWRAKGYYPYIKVGKRVWINPDDARKALEARFTINAQ